MKILIIFLSMVIVSCSLINPDRPTASAQINNKWVSSSPEIMNNSKLDRESGTYWWAKYQDNTLNQLMESAFKYNNQLQIAGSNVELANAQLKRIEYAWIPNISLMTGYSSFPAMGNLGYFFGGFANYTVNVLQLIEQQKQAEYIVKTIMYAKKRVQLEVIHQVAISYFSLLAYERELVLYEKLLNDSYLLLNLNQKRFSTGISSEKEPFISQAEIAEIKSKLEIIKHNIVLSQNALKFLINQNPGQIIHGNNFNNLNSDILIPGDLPLTVLNNRPDVMEVTAKLQAANAGVGVSQSQLLPTISFSNFYRDASQNISNGYNPIDFKQTIVNVPILNAQIFADIAVSNAIYKQVYYNYLQTIVGALREIDNDISAHRQFTKQLTDNNIALNYIDKSCSLELVRFNTGISNQLEYTKCLVRNDYYQIIVTQIKMGKLLATAKLYQDFAIIKE